MTGKYPCSCCGRRRMSAPNSECADCYLAATVLSGARTEEDLWRVLQGQPDRIVFIDDLLRRFRENIPEKP